ncbi:uncharacterized protein [Physcomitrium patens]|nr:MAP kinase kinase kinase SSK2-like isoform X3 [Physcomitrium patens]XP_024360942.1 MAP kinase kinase kinase SSK2-like isoform X3 [Physcomitrium patens]|eukprot:XP_024360941.1 MAP kinase kinase kinase SSK2-like isoform X3 [Physcomitrella patens]
MARIGCVEIMAVWRSCINNCMQSRLFSWWKPNFNSIELVGSNGLLNLCKETIAKTLTRSSEKHFMNKHQCVLLFQRLSETHDTLTKVQQSISFDLDEKLFLVLQELLQVLQDVERVIQSSYVITSEWLRAAIEQSDMKETFSKLIYEMQWHTDVLQSICMDCIRISTITFELAWCFGQLSVRDEFALLAANKEDEIALKNSFTSLRLQKSIERDFRNQLLKKMEALEDQLASPLGGSHQLLENEDQHKEQSTIMCKDSNEINSVTSSLNLFFLSPQDLLNCLSGELVGLGASGRVQRINLLGSTFTMKIFEQKNTTSFDQEMAAMQKLGHHPHVVHLLCYSKTDDKCFLIMEKMDMDLSQFLQEKKVKGNKLSVVEAIVLMLNIAEGIRYIHSKQMAHCDLKPRNVLVNVEVDPLSKLLKACAVKITDFGLTKTKNVGKTYTDQTWDTDTLWYVAPEVAKGKDNRSKRVKFNLMKADAYSFGILCSEILSGEKMSEDQPAIDLKKKVKASDSPESRPDLSKVSFPPLLESLIRRCWAENSRVRPKFDRICEELRFIKGLLLRGDHKILESDDNWEELGSKIKGAKTKQHQISCRHCISGNFEEGEKSSNVAASMKGVRQGPWGRHEPNKKTGLFDHVAASIKWIRLKYQQNPPGIGLLEVGYLELDGEEYVEKYSSDIIGTTYCKIDFKPDEYIKQVTGSVARHEVTVGDDKVGLICVSSLTIHTNIKTYGPFGDDTMGTQFKSGIGEVIGFFGASGVLLDKLGVWIIPNDQEDGDPSHLIEQS